MPNSIVILIGTAVLGVIAIIFGLLVDMNIVFALGLTDAFISLILMPVFYTRGKKMQRIFNRQDALLVWQYAPYEAAHIAGLEAKKTRKASVKLSILACVCLAVIFAPFPVIIEDAATKQLLLYIGIAAALLPFTSLLIAPAWTSRQITKDPSLTVIGRDYILLNNRYIGINDRASLTLVDAEIKTGGNTATGGFTALFLTYTFTMKYGSIMHFSVEVPIPGSRAKEATEFAKYIKGQQINK
jgi:hypothetical protein